MADDELATIITEYINIKDGTIWKLKWGELINDTLYLYSSKQDGHWKSIPNHIVKVKRLNVQPVDDALDCGLAFQLEDRGDIKIALKPLNTLDLGRWISSLFVAIKGTGTTIPHKTHERNDNVTETHVENAEEYQQEEQEEAPHFVDVKNITQKFEKLAVTEVAEAPRRLSRSLSTPTYTTEETIDVDLLEELEDDKKSREYRQRPLSMSEMSDQSLVEVQSSTSSVVAEKENKDAEVIKCSAGPYRVLDADVLRTMVNPFLAKRRLTKQEQQIRKLHKTIDDTVKRIERQRNLMKETREILSELQNRASEMEEREKIIALENECFHLQMQIDESQQNVNKYRMLIGHIENEIIQSKTAIIQQNSDNELEKHEQNPKEGMKAEMSHDSIKLEQEEQNEEQDENEQQYRAEPLKFTWSLNGVEKTPSESDSDEDLRHPEMNQDTPDWAKQACMKSKRAYKILAKEGIL